MYKYFIIADIDIEDLTLDVCKLKDINGSSPCTNQCSKKCSLRPTTIELMDDDEKVWIKPANATELFKALMTKTMNTEYMLVAGNTAHGNHFLMAILFLKKTRDSQSITFRCLSSISEHQSFHRRSKHHRTACDNR